VSLAEERSRLRAAAQARLREQALADRQATATQTGAIEPWTANLAPGISPSEVEAAYSADPAWVEDMALAHSSAALTVNLFAPWLAHPARLSIAGASGFGQVQLEVAASLGLSGTPAYYDALATGERTSVAVEVKCLEYLAEPAEKYRLGFEQSIREICEAHGSSEEGWLGEANRLNRDPSAYSALFVHQLVKQAFAVAHQLRTGNHLLYYLFWEPADWRAHPFFNRHRGELDRLSRAVKDETIGFRFQSVNELLDEWADRREPAWLAAHTVYLERRYRVEIGGP
jgi:hypothetical protein